MLRLALALGEPDWRKVLALPEPVVRVWFAYLAKLPPPQERVEYAVARLTALTANCNRDPKKRSQPYETTDFLPYMDAWGERKESGLQPWELELMGAVQQAPEG